MDISDISPPILAPEFQGPDVSAEGTRIFQISSTENMLRATSSN